MRSWTDIEGRRGATIAFCEFMEDPNNAEIRERCCRYGHYARRLFAKIGQYYLEEDLPPGQSPPEPELKPIPAGVEFHVFNFEDAAKDDHVVLLLPERGTPTPDPVEVWRCSWMPWLAHH